ncbi:MAG: hypothetical protein ABIR11_10375 [Candidatus Limnocylindrales bacterium]
MDEIPFAQSEHGRALGTDRHGAAGRNAEALQQSGQVRHFGVASRTELATTALREGWLDLPAG